MFKSPFYLRVKSTTKHFIFSDVLFKFTGSLNGSMIEHLVIYCYVSNITVI